jgi:hypothetical protein
MNAPCSDVGYYKPVHNCEQVSFRQPGAAGMSRRPQPRSASTQIFSLPVLSKRVPNGTLEELASSALAEAQRTVSGGLKVEDTPGSKFPTELGR